MKPPRAANPQPLPDVSGLSDRQTAEVVALVVDEITAAASSPDWIAGLRAALDIPPECECRHYTEGTG